MPTNKSSALAPRFAVSVLPAWRDRPASQHDMERRRVRATTARCSFTDAELCKLVHGVVGDIVGETIGNETVLSFRQFVRMLTLNARGVTAEALFGALCANFASGAPELTPASLVALSEALGMPPAVELQDAVDPGARSSAGCCPKLQ